MYGFVMYYLIIILFSLHRTFWNETENYGFIYYNYKRKRNSNTFVWNIGNPC